MLVLNVSPNISPPHKPGGTICANILPLRVLCISRICLLRPCRLSSFLPHDLHGNDSLGVLLSLCTTLLTFGGGNGPLSLSDEGGGSSLDFLFGDLGSTLVSDTEI